MSPTGTVAFGNVTIGNVGTQTFTVSNTRGALQSGSNVLTVTARDAAGNASTDTLTVTLTGSVTSHSPTTHSPHRARRSRRSI